MGHLNIGVLGATGQIGSELINLLSQQENISICAFVRDLSRAQQMSWNNVELRQFDFSCPNNIFHNIDRIFWLIPNNNAPETGWIEILKSSSIKKFVLLSSIYPDIFDLRSSEILIEQSGIPYTILRPNTFMQNFNHFDKESIIKNNVFYYPASTGKTSFIDTRDIAEAAKIILLSDGHVNKIYTLTGEKSLNYYQVAEILSKVYGKIIRYIDTSIHPEFEPEDKKNDIIWQKYFAGVRNDLFSEITKDLPLLLGHPAREFDQYVNDYWKNN